MATQSPLLPLSLRYFLRVPNFGDLLNPLLVAKLAPLAPYWTTDAQEPHLMAVGSLMAGANRHSSVWGTGVMHPDLGLGQADPGRIHALRGPHSYQALRGAGLALRDMPFGDPAILAPMLFGIAAHRAPRHRLGVVAHYIDRKHPAVRGLIAQDGGADINVHDDPLAVIRAMADCAVIISSSLHGLILAEALGLPSLWVTASGELGGGRFKFDDWFATTANPQTNPHPLQPGEHAEALIAMAEPRAHIIEFGPLIDAFGAAIDIPIAQGARVRTQDIAQCRRAPLPVFLISDNRPAMLAAMIERLRQLSTDLDIIILDNDGGGSADQQVERVNGSVARYFADWAEPSAYVISDCNIDFPAAGSDLLVVCRDVLNHFRKTECAGPMLPGGNAGSLDHLPFSALVEGRQLTCHQGLIDAGFAMHRAGEAFRQNKSGILIRSASAALDPGEKRGF